MDGWMDSNMMAMRCGVIERLSYAKYVWEHTQCDSACNLTLVRVRDPAVVGNASFSGIAKIFFEQQSNHLTKACCSDLDPVLLGGAPAHDCSSH